MTYNLFWRVFHVHFGMNDKIKAKHTGTNAMQLKYFKREICNFSYIGIPLSTPLIVLSHSSKANTLLKFFFNSHGFLYTFITNDCISNQNGSHNVRVLALLTIVTPLFISKVLYVLIPVVKFH